MTQRPVFSFDSNLKPWFWTKSLHYLCRCIKPTRARSFTIQFLLKYMTRVSNAYFSTFCDKKLLLPYPPCQPVLRQHHWLGRLPCCRSKNLSPSSYFLPPTAPNSTFKTKCVNVQPIQHLRTPKKGKIKSYTLPVQRTMIFKSPWWSWASDSLAKAI